MSKVDYEFIAGCVAMLAFAWERRALAIRLANYFGRNPRFDRSKFLRACDVKE